MSRAKFSRIRLVLGLATLVAWTCASVAILVVWDARRPTEPPRTFAPFAYGCTIEMPGPPLDVVLVGTEKARETSHYAVVLRRPWERYGIALKTTQPFDFGRENRFAELEAWLGEFQTQYKLAVNRAPAYSVAGDGLLKADGEYTSATFGRVVVRVVGAGSRLFLLVVAGSEVASGGPEVVRYFDSFRIVDQDLLDDAKRSAALYEARRRRETRLRKLESALYLRADFGLPSPLLYWPCDDVDDDETLEAISKDDTFLDGAQPVPSPCGGGLRLPLDDRPALVWQLDDELRTPWTIGLWLKVPEGDVEVLRTEAAMIDVRGDRLRFLRFDWAGATVYAETEKPKPGSWIHLAVTSSDFGNLTAYVNGKTVGEERGQGAEREKTVLQTLAVGMRRGESTAIVIDELVLFSVNLNDDELRRWSRLTSDPR